MKNQRLANRNEIQQGPAPECLKAIQDLEMEDLDPHKQGYHSSLVRPVLAEKYDLPEAQIAISYGDEVFFRTIFDQLQPNRDKVLTNELHFKYYDSYLAVKKIEQHEFELTDVGNEFRFDLEDCLEKCKLLQPSILLITSPNNPTGNSLTHEDLEYLLLNVSGDCLVIIDEAYWGFDSKYDDEKAIQLLTKFPQLIFIRTFSKLYALAGLRLGFAFMGTYAKEKLGCVPPYLGMSVVLEKPAVAALRAEKYYENLRQEIIADRENFIQKTNGLKHFTAYNSEANFVAVKVAQRVWEKLNQALENESVLISKVVREGLLRVTIRDKYLTNGFLQVLHRLEDF